jgi:hypothetical protein
MYIVKLNNRKLSLKLFAKGFKSYDLARNTLRKYLRTKGLSRNINQHGYAIERV